MGRPKRIGREIEVTESAVGGEGGRESGACAVCGDGRGGRTEADGRERKRLKGEGWVQRRSGDSTRWGW
jgi:hypothetical protein